MKALLTVVALLMLAGCATTVGHYSDTDNPRHLVAGEKVSKVSLSLSESGQKDFQDNGTFDQNALLSDVKQQLASKQLFSDATAADMLEIKITGMRVRSTFNAVMWGFMAGSDNVTGDVYLRDASGRQIDHFQIHASYALGGFVGGIESVRWGWLYGKFAELTVENLMAMSGQQ